MIDYGNELVKDWFLQPTEQVARELIGKIIVRFDDFGNALGGKIVESEAYLSQNDLSSHSVNGETKRNRAMFAEAGTIYVYRSYGIHLCMNISTCPQGIGEAVLIRAIEPIYGKENMIANRGIADERRLCKGPGNLTRALGICMEDNFQQIGSKKFKIFSRNEALSVSKSKRIGITKSTELELRFFENNSRFITK